MTSLSLPLSSLAVPSAKVLNLREIVALVEEDLARVERVFQEQFLSDLPVIPQVADYVRAAGGKRIRPALLLLAARLHGHSSDRAITLAAVVEYIHTATLLHDDVIDSAATRRGRTSANSRWGNPTTVLIGDFLYTKSMAMALTQDNLGILRILSDVTLRMIEGQLLEIEREGDLGATPDQHLDIIRRKTADLFAACMRIGAILGGAPAAREKAAEAYGLSLGVAFQMADDLLDFTSTEGALGKPVGHDLREGKVTLPVIFALQRATPEARARVQQVIEDRGFQRTSHADLLAIAEETGAIDTARSLAERHAEDARRALDAFPPSNVREALLALPSFVLSRNS